ncbi:MAG TPA: hypothetical protein VNR67_03245 [Solirubrobacterales bacterium]|nr:hypothetical protein [Solirubrobacterales bacterium]
MRISRPRLNYANVIATIALFVALGGAAVAAGLPRNSVGANQIKRGAVTAAKLKRGAVLSGKIGPQAVTAGKLGANAVLAGNLGNGVIGTSKLADSAVIASKIKNSVVTTNKLNNGAVTSAKLGDGAVNSSKLNDGSVSAAKLNSSLPGQLQTKAASGATFRGTFDLGSVAAATGDSTRGAISLPFPVPAPTALGVTVVLPGQGSVPNCPGLGAEGDTPQANPSKLCIYLTKTVNLDDNQPLEPENVTRLGTGLVVKAKEAGTYYGYGQWAYTAP